MSHEEIAIGLGVARGTLEKHFSEELTKGAYRKRLAVMVANYQAALKGSVPAQKAYLSSMPQAAAPERPPPAAPDARLGKKQQAALDALDAEKNTGWEGLLGPSPPLQ